MAIYPATEQHYALLTEIWEASVRATHHFLSEADIAFLRPLIAERYLPAVDAYYFADKDDKPLGFIGVSGLHIEMLFIHPDCRGMGIGKTLLNFAVNELAAASVDVNEQNQQGVDFYLYMGFKIVGRSATDRMGNPFPLLHLVYNL